MWWLFAACETTTTPGTSPPTDTATTETVPTVPTEPTDTSSSGTTDTATTTTTTTTPPPPPPPPVWLVGVNLAGAEFGEDVLPGQVEVDYTYPTTDEIDYFQAKGMTVIRLPFRWERLQPCAGCELDEAELARLDALVEYATSKEMSVILDPHNYARYWGSIVGEAVPNEDYADLWRRLAELYGAEPLVIFGLMNEPHTMGTETWLGAANAAIDAIRAAGATNLVLVPGNAWTGAHSWLQDWYGTPNGTVMTGVVDPGNNFAFEAHQYLDGDSSGTTDSCSGPTVGSERLVAFTGWLRDHGYRGFLGEFGAPSNMTCDAAVDDLLAYLEANQDVWIGWTWWAAGPWWGDYSYSLEPDGAGDAPQMSVLTPYL